MIKELFRKAILELIHIKIVLDGFITIPKKTLVLNLIFKI